MYHKPFHTWFEARQRSAISGSILTIGEDPIRIIPVANATGQQLLALTQERGRQHREKYPSHIDNVSCQMQKADRSDPFTRDRVRSHLRSGTADLSNYSCEFIKEHRSYTRADGEEVPFTVDVPIRQKRM
jgi:hypothetical protein